MSEAEAVARDFAAQWSTPNVRLAISYAESGRITWEALAEMFREALGKALTDTVVAESEGRI